MYAPQTIMAVAQSMNIDAGILFAKLADQQKRERRYRNRQNDGKHEYQPVSQAGKDFYNLRKMYAGFSD